MLLGAVPRGNHSTRAAFGTGPATTKCRPNAGQPVEIPVKTRFALPVLLTYYLGLPLAICYIINRTTRPWTFVGTTGTSSTSRGMELPSKRPKRSSRQLRVIIPGATQTESGLFVDEDAVVDCCK